MTTEEAIKILYEMEVKTAYSGELGDLAVKMAVDALRKQEESETPSPDEAREKVIQSLANLLRTTPFSVEFKVVKNPKGILIIHEVTQEHLDAVMKKAAKNHRNET